LASLLGILPSSKGTRRVLNTNTHDNETAAKVTISILWVNSKHESIETFFKLKRTPRMEKLMKALCKRNYSMGEWTNAYPPIILSIDEGGAHIEGDATVNSLGLVGDEKLFARLVSREESVSSNAYSEDHSLLWRHTLEQQRKHWSSCQHLKLLDAAEYDGWVAEMQMLLAAAGANKDWNNSSGLTALACAAAHDQWHTAKILLEAGADKDKANKTGYTPLHVAAKKGHTRVVVMLWKLGPTRTRQPRADAHRFMWQLRKDTRAS
jgi:hypothetical protein